MAQITTLKDKEGKTIYPITSSQAVFDANGVDLDTRLNDKVSKENGKVLSSNDYTNADKQKLDSLPTYTELTQALNVKQDILQNSDDVTITNGKLSLTERAKNQWVIDQFNDWCNIIVGGQMRNFGGFNYNTGYFECNGITNIGIQEAKAMLAYAPLTRFMLPNHGENRWAFLNHQYATLRTIFPLYFVNSGSASGHSDAMFAYWSKLEVVEVIQSNFSSKVSMFYNCTKLKRVTGLNAYNAAGDKFRSCFYGCSSLEYVELLNLNNNVSFQWSPLLKSDTIRIITQKKSNTTAVVITVHPDVYAKLTDEDNEEWFPLIELAQAKNITFATTN